MKLVVGALRQWGIRLIINCGNPSIHRQLCLPTIPGGKERGRTKASNKPQGPKLLQRGRALQDGRPAPSSRFDPASGLDGQATPFPQLKAAVTSSTSLSGQGLPGISTPVW